MPFLLRENQVLGCITEMRRQGRSAAIVVESERLWGILDPPAELHERVPIGKQGLPAM